MPTARCPKRAPSSPPGKAVSPASSGPGAIMKPARSTDSCQTPVRKRTPPSTSAPKPPKKASELRSASATARWRMTAGSMIGLGWRKERSDEPGARHGGQREGAEDPRAGPAPVRALDDGGDQAGHRDGQQRRAEQVGLVGLGVPDLVEQCGRRRTSATTAKGRLTRKTQRQLAWTSSPPIGGPEGGGRATDGRPQADGRALALGTERRAAAGRARSAA